MMEEGRRLSPPPSSIEARSLALPISPLDELSARVAKDLGSNLTQGARLGGFDDHQPSLGTAELDQDDFFGGSADDEAYDRVAGSWGAPDESEHQRTGSNTSNGHFADPPLDSNRISLRSLPRLDTTVSINSHTIPLAARERILSPQASKDSMQSSGSRSNGLISRGSSSAPPQLDTSGGDDDSRRSRTASAAGSASAAGLRRRSSFFEEGFGHTRETSIGRTGSSSPEPSSSWRRSMPGGRSYPPSLDGGSQPDLANQPMPRYDQSHLKPGSLASLLSSEKTLELYRANVKKTNDPDVAYEFAVFLMEVARDQHGNNFSPAASATTSSSEQSPSVSMQSVDVSNYGGKKSALTKRRGSGKDRIAETPSAQSAPASAVEETSRLLGNAPHMVEACQILRRYADRGHVASQALLGDAYARGWGTGPKCKPDYDKAFSLFVLAGKHGHADGCYRVGQCCEHGWGCRKDLTKAYTWYNKAASTQHAAAMFRLGIAGLNSELGLSRRQKEGFKWLKRAAELAYSQPEASTIQALHQLALLHERGVEHVIFIDFEYAAELLAKASELGYAPSAYKLGECYEYGRMGCPQDSALSIHYYNIAAQQDHREACFALTAWYLVGSPGVLPQSDTEAYLWAKKAAEQGLAKAQYAVGYFTEVGMGRHKDPREAMSWFRKAADQGDDRAIQRVKANAHQIAQMQREEAARQAQIRREAAQREAAAQRARREKEAAIARAKAEKEATLARERAAQEAKEAAQRERERRIQERQLAAFRSTPGNRQEHYYSQGGKWAPLPGLPPKSPSIPHKLSSPRLPPGAGFSDAPRSRTSSSNGSPRVPSLPPGAGVGDSPRSRTSSSTRPPLPLPPGGGMGGGESPRPRSNSSNTRSPVSYH